MINAQDISAQSGGAKLDALKNMRARFGKLTLPMLEALDRMYGNEDHGSYADMWDQFNRGGVRVDPQNWWGGGYGPPGAFRGPGNIPDVLAQQHTEGLKRKRMGDLREAYPSLIDTALEDSYAKDRQARLAEMMVSQHQPAPRVPASWFMAPRQPMEATAGRMINGRGPYGRYLGLREPEFD